MVTIPEGMSVAEYLADVKSTQWRQHSTGLAAGFASENLEEEYFQGQEGVNFIGSMPFFTVRAGKDLFGSPQAKLSELRTGSLTDSTLFNTASTTFEDTLDSSNPVEHRTDVESSLSDISSSRLGFNSSPVPELENFSNEVGESTSAIATSLKHSS
jgi:hypothetical protein